MVAGDDAGQFREECLRFLTLLPMPVLRQNGPALRYNEAFCQAPAEVSRGVLFAGEKSWINS